MKKLLPKFIGLYYYLLGFIAKEKATRKAFLLFATPQLGRLTESDKVFLSSSENQQYLKTPAGKVKAYEWNKGGTKTILLLHGWESNSARWQNLIKLLLEENCHVVTIDAPAHGDSDGEQFNMMLYGEFINAAHQYFKPDYTIGHSVGGGSLTYYLSHFDSPKPKGIALLGVPSELEQMLQIYVRIVGLKNRTLEAMRQYIREHTGRAIRYFSVEKFCEKINLPTLIVHDSEDDIATLEDSQKYHRILPGSQLVLTSGLGHSMQGYEVYERVLQFVQKGN